MNNLKITQCKGEGLGCCEMCYKNGICIPFWMCFLYEIEGYKGCYCHDCVEKIKEGIGKI